MGSLVVCIISYKRKYGYKPWGQRMPEIIYKDITNDSVTVSSKKEKVTILP